MLNITKKIPKIFVAGHNGLVGSAIVRELGKQGFSNIVTRTRSELELTDQKAVRLFMKSEKPDQIYLAAAKVGGIYANNAYPADFIYQNLMIECNIIEASFRCNIPKLLFLGSSCIYPKFAKQPICESALLSGVLEPTNEPYAIAKIAGIKLCESYNRQFGESLGLDYRSVMPTNLYGPGDSYHSENSHVIPALIRRIHEAKINNSQSVTIWGTGRPKREFLYVDDMASACIYIMNLEKETYNQATSPNLSHINVGSGIEISIQDLAETIKKTIGFEGYLEFDANKPDGTPKKLMDNSLIKRLGWSPLMDLETGLKMTYQDFLNR